MSVKPNVIYQEDAYPCVPEDDDKKGVSFDDVLKGYTQEAKDNIHKEVLHKVQSMFKSDMDREVFNRLPLSDAQKIELLMGLGPQEPQPKCSDSEKLSGSEKLLNSEKDSGSGKHSGSEKPLGSEQLEQEL